ncbi:zinc finger protein 107-like [Nymphalis io]|uniref:zinc finger protein 107-like n=1 Tax=Inachis io TaxID=171585 RepID=UPI0021681042|nr:zinc finger protein 107-like [Nymphalis io]
MELLSLLINPGKCKICMLCYKECNNTLNIYNNVEIEGNISKDLNIAAIVKHLFPAFDITLSYVCQVCSELLYKMYLKMEENKYRKKILRIIINTLYNELNEYENLNIEALKKVYLNVNLSTILNSNQDAPTKCSNNINFDRNIESNVFENEIETETENTDFSLQRQCPHCSKLFDNIKRYKAHVKSHGSKQKQKYYYCNHCNYKSHCKLSVQGHINKNHLKTRPHICQMCFKSFFHKKNLKEHIENHEQVHNEMCEVCGKRFLHKRNLVEHLKLHSGDRPYECEICSKKFVTSGRRLEHIKRIHMEKTENCLFCDKKFSLNKELTRHMKSVHSTF